MSMLAHLKSMARYNLWAHQLVLRHVKTLPEEIYKADSGLYFRSIHGTLVHITAGERVWHARLTTGDESGLEYLWVDGTPADWESLYPSLDEVSAKLIESAQMFIDYVDTLDDSQLDQSFEYCDTKGTAYSNQRSASLAHLFNHGTHHRGQVSAALTQHKFPAPAMDYSYYLREVKRDNLQS
eukprot:GILK01005735.1.p1 GENE.GILK01005735.1~~GILK01005735.1.p1  ORF type:complete len:182 (+),score=12.99 GILK01005735.1:46-591(+)